MDKIQIENMYSPTGNREAHGTSGYGMIISYSMVGGSAYPSGYSGQLPAYPGPIALQYLGSARVIYTGSQGTVEARSVSRYSVTGKTFVDIGIDSYEVPYTNLSFYFINPANGYVTLCRVVVDQGPTTSDAYWVDNNGQRVSDIFTANSFKFAVFHSGLIYHPERGLCLNLVVYMETVENSGHRIYRFDGPGDNRFLPYPYDPDNIHPGIQTNGIIMGGMQFNTVGDVARVEHDITLTTDQELT